MANSLGLQNAIIICQKAMALVFQKYPLTKIFSMDLGDLDGRAKAPYLGQIIDAKIRTLPTMGNFGDAANPFTMTDIQIPLSNFRQFQYTFKPEEYNAAEYPLIAMAAETLAPALALAIAKAIGSLVSLSNFGTTVNGQGSTVTVASAWTRANTILPLKEALDIRGAAPGMPRHVLFNSTVEAALAADTVIVGNLYNPDQASAIRTGELPMISGMNMFGWPGLPANDGNLSGFACTPDALVYCCRAPINPTELLPGLPLPALIENIIEPNSGFQVQVQFWWDPTSTNINMRWVWFDGLGVGNATNLVRLVTGAVTGGSTGVPNAAAVVTNPGYGYVNSSGTPTAPTVTITAAAGDNTGGGATGVASISTNGAVTGIAITGGTAYTLPPVVAIAPVSGGKAAGTASAYLPVYGLI